MICRWCGSPDGVDLRTTWRCNACGQITDSNRSVPVPGPTPTGPAGPSTTAESNAWKWWLGGILGVLGVVLVFLVYRLSASGMFDDTWRWCPTAPGTSSMCSVNKDICEKGGDQNCKKLDKVWCPNSSPVCYRELAECEEHEDALCHQR